MTSKKRVLSFWFLVLFIIVCSALIFSVNMMLYRYSDDVYYHSFLKHGISHFILKNVEHYQNTNGRLFVHLLAEILLCFGNGLFAVINTGMVLGFAVAACKCFEFSLRASRKESCLAIAAMILFLILCLPTEITRESLYWITGSMNYMLPAFMAIIMYYLLKKNIDGSKNTAALFLISFLAGATTEQGGFVAVALSALLIFATLFYDKKPPRKLYCFSVLFAVAGFLSVVLAPGTFTRISLSGVNGLDAPGLWHTVLDNIPVVSVYMTGKAGISYLLALQVLAVFFVTIRDKRISKIFLAGPLILAAFICQRAFALYDQTVCVWLVAVCTVYLVWWALSVLRLREYADAAIFLLSALGLQIFMLVSPVLGPRAILITALFLAASIAGLSARLLSEPIYFVAYACTLAFMLLPPAAAVVLIVVSVGLFFIRRAAIPQFLVMILILAFVFTPVIRGYYTNYRIFMTNQKNISKAQISGKLYWNIDLIEPYYHSMFYENGDFTSYFLDVNALPQDTKIYLVSNIHKPIYFQGRRLQAPSIQQDIRYYPLRDIFEAMGANVTWEERVSRIKINLAGIQYIFEPGSLTIIRNGQTRIEKNNAKTILGRTYVPKEIIQPFAAISDKGDYIELEPTAMTTEAGGI